MIKKILPFVLLLAFVACNNDNPSQNEGRESVVEVEEPYTDPAKQEISSAFPATYQFFSGQDSSFDASRFEQMSEDTINSPDLALDKTSSSYAPLFIYNSDSTYAIDLYSYNVVLHKKNGKTVANQAGPDTEVSLIDLKNKKRKRIYFGGSSSSVLDAKWMNNDELFLLTGEIVNPSGFQPQILQYKPSDNSANKFIYSDTLQLNVADYTDSRLENF